MSVRQVTNLLRYNKIFSIQRTLTNRPASQPHPLSEKFKLYQMDDGIPVYQKGGFSDRILFQLTLLLIGIGLIEGMSTLFGMAFKKKK